MIFKVLSWKIPGHFIHLLQDLPGRRPKTCSQALTNLQLSYGKTHQLLGIGCLFPIPEQIKQITCTGSVGFCFPAATEEIGTETTNHQSHGDNINTVPGEIFSWKAWLEIKLAVTFT